MSPSSYPIEVAWSTEDGVIECHLINPTVVDGWTDWGAEHIHGIPRQYLVAEGADPAWLAGRMNQCLAGRTVYSDAKGLDGFWLRRLFSAVQQEMQFAIGDVVKDLLMNHALGTVLRDDAAMSIFKACARAEAGGEHRAVPDVRYLQNLYRLLREVG